MGLFSQIFLDDEYAEADDDDDDDDDAPAGGGGLSGNEHIIVGPNRIV